MPILDKHNPEAVSRYEAFVKTSPHATATQDLGWADVKKGWGDVQVYLEQDGEITAALSLITRTVLRRFVMLYAPRGPVCDPYDLDTISALLEELRPYAKRHHAFLLRLDPEIPYDEAFERRCFDRGFVVRGKGLSANHDLIQPRFNMILTLEGKTEEEILAEFSQKTRYNIRVAKKNGVTVRHSRDPADLDAFYKLFLVTCVRDGIGARGKDYFERMLGAFGENCRIYLAEHEGEALSGAIAISYGSKVWYSYGASGNEKRNLMPNHAMQLEMIRWGLEQGKAYYDFGGVYELSKENGLYRFKEGFCRKQGPTELIGELDYVYGKLIYRAFTVLLPRFKRLRAKAARKQLTQSEGV